MHKRKIWSTYCLAVKPHQEKVKNNDDFVWKMCVRYRALNRVILPFQYPIGLFDDNIEYLEEGDGVVYIL